MFRASIAAMMSFLASVPLFGAEMRFKTMRLPPNVHVQIEGSTARVSGEQLGIETIWNCSCTGRAAAPFRTTQVFSPATRVGRIPVKLTASFPLV
jgi:hypothetical protein